MTVSLVLNRPRWADVGENEISIHPPLLQSLLILFYHLLHASHSVSSEGYTHDDPVVIHSLVLRPSFGLFKAL